MNSIKEDKKYEKLEKYIVPAAKVLGVVAIIGGIHMFYRVVPHLYAGEGSVGLASLRIIKGVLNLIFGYGLIRIFKKSLDLFVSPLIFFPLMGYIALTAFSHILYYEFSLYRLFFAFMNVSVLIFMIYCWFDYRKKYPEAWGFSSSKLAENPENSDD